MFTFDFAIVLGILRVLGVTHIAFQAVAHLWVGGLFVAAFIKAKKTWKVWTWRLRTVNRRCFWQAISLCILEIACASLGTLKLF